MKKHIAILGSTGSIGTQALEVIEKNPDTFSLEVLTAQKSSKLLISQAIKFMPRHVVITEEDKYCEVCDALRNYPIQVHTGNEALNEIVRLDTIDTVLTALVGYAGLFPTISALEAGKNIALANKETLVIAGELITALARTRGAAIYPVDSEHSAIFQCLAGENHNPFEKIYLTASGGPFRTFTKEALQKVTKKEALNHPNWCMGAKVTIDSASLMNKGLEAIEAKWLFGLQPDQIDVIVHPQSIIHSIVQFTDGSMKAQMGLPDMRLPIQYALGFPNRLNSDFKRFNFLDYPNLSFELPRREVFRNLDLAFEAMHLGGNMPCIMNAANEVAVEAFLNDRIGFMDIPDLIKNSMTQISFQAHPSLSDYAETDCEARKYTATLIK
ncbi:MAG: 1-deoxy-D-xylulose-5-phosphate reductoisomerase [Bacteroidota bacterium]|nr:MAG: 1-deoxy-D-xylulose-5-phosphate reductoisomerase [Bacteroidota bacterium]